MAFVPASVPDSLDDRSMSPAAQQVLQLALTLPEDERLDVVDAPIASRSYESELPCDPELLVEIHRRSAEIDSVAVQTAPWSVVRDRVRRRLEGRPSR